MSAESELRVFMLDLVMSHSSLCSTLDLPVPYFYREAVLGDVKAMLVSSHICGRGWLHIC